ncbi:MAG: flagellar motor switch protein FliM [Oscillospiraceae bacterium]
MAEVLSQKQIDELLKGISSGTVEVNENADDKKVKEYDFKSPKKFTKEQLKTLNGIHQSYARLLSSYFTGVLRLMTQVTVFSIEEQVYYEYNNALPDNVFMGIVDLKPESEEISESLILYEISKNTCFSIIDRMLGGSGEGLGADREFTEIEIVLMENTLKQTLRMLKESWINYLEIDPLLLNVETNSRLAQTIGHDEVVVIIVMEILIKDKKGSMNICIPALHLEEIMIQISARNTKINRKIDEMKEAAKKESILKTVKDSELKIRGILGELELSVRDVLGLQINDIIQIDKDVNSDIIISVDEYKWFTGKIGTKRNKKAIKINKIIQERGSENNESE